MQAGDRDRLVVAFCPEGGKGRQHDVEDTKVIGKVEGHELNDRLGGEQPAGSGEADGEAVGECLAAGLILGVVSAACLSPQPLCLARKDRARVGFGKDNIGGEHEDGVKY